MKRRAKPRASSFGGASNTKLSAAICGSCASAFSERAISSGSIIAAPVTSSGLFGVASGGNTRSEEHTSELQSLMRISYAVFCLKKKNKHISNYLHIFFYIK